MGEVRERDMGGRSFVRVLGFYYDFPALTRPCDLVLGVVSSSSARLAYHFARYLKIAEKTISSRITLF